MSGLCPLFQREVRVWWPEGASCVVLALHDGYRTVDLDLAQRPVELHFLVVALGVALYEVVSLTDGIIPLAVELGTGWLHVELLTTDAQLRTVIGLDLFEEVGGCFGGCELDIRSFGGLATAVRPRIQVVDGCVADARESALHHVLICVMRVATDVSSENPIKATRFLAGSI